jgi:hypothetical protein
MRRALLYIVICFISYSAFSQDTIAIAPVAKKDSAKTRTYSINGTTGYSLLLGHLQGVSYGSPKSGYSSFEGYNFGVEGTCWLSNRFGIGGMLTNSSFYAAQTGLANMAIGYQQSMFADSAKVQALTKYNFYNLFVGPYFSFPLKSKKFTVDVRAVGGLTFVSTPDFDIVVVNLGIPYPFAQIRSTAFSYGFQAGGGIRYNFDKHVGIKINVDFYYTDPNIKIVNSNFPSNSGREISDYHQSVMMLHFNFGISYKFGIKSVQNIAKY